MDSSPEMELPPVDMEILEQMMDLGFSEVRARKALMSGADSVEACAEWILEHDEDDGIDDEIPLVPRTSISESEEKGSAEAASTTPAESGDAVENEEDGDQDEQILPPVDEALLAEVMVFGFSEVRARKGIMALTPPMDVERVVNWVLEHGDDPGIDDPIPTITRRSPRSAATEALMNAAQRAEAAVAIVAATAKASIGSSSTFTGGTWLPPNGGHGGSPMSFEEGCEVVLSDDYASVGDASGGPLVPGMVGVVEKVTGQTGSSDLRYQVRSKPGSSARGGGTSHKYSVGDPVDYQSYAGCTISRVHAATGRVDVKIPGRITAAAVPVSEVRPRSGSSRGGGAGGRTWWYAPAALRRSGPWGDLEALASALHVAEAQGKARQAALVRAREARLALAEALFAAALEHATAGEAHNQSGGSDEDAEEGKVEAVQALIAKATVDGESREALCSVSEATLGEARKALDGLLEAQRKRDVKLGELEFLRLVGFPRADCSRQQGATQQGQEEEGASVATNQDSGGGSGEASQASSSVASEEEGGASGGASLPNEARPDVGEAASASTASDGMDAEAEAASPEPQASSSPAVPPPPPSAEDEARASTEPPTATATGTAVTRFWETDPEALVGRRVEILWSGGQRYAGEVTEYRESDGKHHVLYDDGDSRWYRMALKTFWLISDADGSLGEKFEPTASERMRGALVSAGLAESSSDRKTDEPPSPLSTVEALIVRLLRTPELAAHLLRAPAATSAPESPEMACSADGDDATAPPSAQSHDGRVLAFFLTDLLPALLDAEGVSSAAGALPAEEVSPGDKDEQALHAVAPILLLPRALQRAAAEAALVPGGGLGAVRRSSTKPARSTSGPSSPRSDSSSALPQGVGAAGSSGRWPSSSCPAEVAMCLEDLAHVLLLLLLGRAPSSPAHARTLHDSLWASRPDRRTAKFLERFKSDGGASGGGALPPLPPHAVQTLAFNLANVGDLVKVCSDVKAVTSTHASYARGIGTNAAMLRDCGAVVPVRDSKVIHRHPVLNLAPSSSSLAAASSAATAAAPAAPSPLMLLSSSSPVPAASHMWSPKLVGVVCRKADVPRYRRLLTRAAASAAAAAATSGAGSLSQTLALTSAEADSALTCLLGVAPNVPAEWSLEANVGDRDLGRLFALFERRHLVEKTKEASSKREQQDRSLVLLGALLDLATRGTTATTSTTMVDEENDVGESKAEEASNLQEAKADDDGVSVVSKAVSEAKIVAVPIPPRLEVLLRRFGVRELLREADDDAQQRRQEEQLDSENREEAFVSGPARLLGLIGERGPSEPSEGASTPAERILARLKAGSGTEAEAALSDLSTLLSAPPSNVALGVSHHELVNLNVAGALLAWLEPKEGDGACLAALRGRLFLRRFLALSPPPPAAAGGAAAQVARSPAPTADDCALVKLVRRLQTVCAAEATLPVYAHRNPTDIVETTSKAIEIKLRFNPAKRRAGSAGSATAPAALAAAAAGGAEEKEAQAAGESGGESESSLPVSTVKATRTADVGDVVAHVLRSLPAPSLPPLYVQACRDLVGLLVRERFARALAPRTLVSGGAASSSSSSRGGSGSGGSGSESSGAAVSLKWRSAVVLAYDDKIGAHKLKYQTAAQTRRLKREILSGEEGAGSSSGGSGGGGGGYWSLASGVDDNEEEEDESSCVWVRLMLRDVVLVGRVAPLQPSPHETSSTSGTDHKDKESDEMKDEDSAGVGAVTLETSPPSDDASAAAAGAAAPPPPAAAAEQESPPSGAVEGPCTVARAGPERPGCFVVTGAEALGGGRAMGVYVPSTLPGYRGVQPFAKEGDERLVMLRWAASHWVICDVGPDRDRFPGLRGSGGDSEVAHPGNGSGNSGGGGQAVEYFRVASGSSTPPTNEPWPQAQGQWVWEVEMGNLEGPKRWVPFEAAVARDLERARSAGTPNVVAFSIADVIPSEGGEQEGEVRQREYEVNLSTMLQTNVSGSIQRQRPVRRVHRADQLLALGGPTVTAPDCPGASGLPPHRMVWSDGARFYSDFHCNKCSSVASGLRWFCSRCQADVCNECHPGPVRSAAGGSSAFDVAAAAAAMHMAGKRVLLKSTASTRCAPVGMPHHRHAWGAPERLAGATVTVLGAGARKGPGFLDLVLDDGRVVRDEPQASVVSTEPRTPRGIPPPVVLQRSFTAVTTKKRPVTDGGYEFERPKDAMVDASKLTPQHTQQHHHHQQHQQHLPNHPNSRDTPLLGLLPKRQRTSGLLTAGTAESLAPNASLAVDNYHEDEDEEEDKDGHCALGHLEQSHPKLVLKLRVRQEKMGRVCPKGHPLQAFSTPNPSFSCDAPGCGRSFPQGTPMHGCRECNFDFCTACVRALAGEDDSDDSSSADDDQGATGTGAGSSSSQHHPKKRSREISAATPLFRALHELMIEFSSAAAAAGSGGGKKEKNVVNNLVSVNDSYDLSCTVCMAAPSHGRGRWTRLPTLFAIELPRKKRKVSSADDGTREGGAFDLDDDEADENDDDDNVGLEGSDSLAVDAESKPSRQLASEVPSPLVHLEKEVGSAALDAVLLLRRLRLLLLAKASGEAGSTADSSSWGAQEEAAAVSATAALGCGAWVNPSLEKTLSDQLKPLAVVTGAVPPWVRWLPRVAPFLWPRELRLRCLKSMGFGVSRAIVAAQEERHPIAKKMDEQKQAYQLMTPAALDRAMRLDEQISAIQQKHATSQLAKNTLVKVDERQLLGQAYLAFSDVGFLRSGTLEVEFEGETGHGSGVTAGFYSRVAAQLQTKAAAFNLPRVALSPLPPPSIESGGNDDGEGAATAGAASSQHEAAQAAANDWLLASGTGLYGDGWNEEELVRSRLVLLELSDLGAPIGTACCPPPPSRGRGDESLLEEATPFLRLEDERVRNAVAALATSNLCVPCPGHGRSTLLALDQALVPPSDSSASLASASGLAGAEVGTLASAMVGEQEEEEEGDDDDEGGSNDSDEDDSDEELCSDDEDEEPGSANGSDSISATMVLRAPQAVWAGEGGNFTRLAAASTRDDQRPSSPPTSDALPEEEENKASSGGGGASSGEGSDSTAAEEGAAPKPDSAHEFPVTGALCPKPFAGKFYVESVLFEPGASAARDSGVYVLVYEKPTLQPASGESPSAKRGAPSSPLSGGAGGGLTELVASHAHKKELARAKNTNLDFMEDGSSEGQGGDELQDAMTAALLEAMQEGGGGGLPTDDHNATNEEDEEERRQRGPVAEEGVEEVVLHTDDGRAITIANPRSVFSEGDAGVEGASGLGGGATALVVQGEGVTTNALSSSGQAPGRSGAGLSSTDVSAGESPEAVGSFVPLSDVVPTSAAFALALAALPGKSLELWTGSKQEFTQRSVKVTVLDVTAAAEDTHAPEDQTDHEEEMKDDVGGGLLTKAFNRVRVTVSGVLPLAWLSFTPPSALSQATQEKERVGPRFLFGQPYASPLWVADSSGAHLSSSGGDPTATLELPNGLFPAPLAPGADGKHLQRQFRFLGRLMGKALVDGFLVPLRLHPSFFALLRGDPVPLEQLASKAGHMVGCKGEQVAQLFSLLPELEEMERRGVGAEEEASLFSSVPSFTGGLALRDWLQNLYLVDPITLSPLAPQAGETAPAGSQAASSSSRLPEWDAEPPCDSAAELLNLLRRVADAWVGTGVAKQVAAFRSGLSDLVDLDSGMLAFEPHELKDLFCGPDVIEWSDESLKRTLKPSGGFSHDEATMRWLRQDLVAMPQKQRLDFMELTTGLRLLTPDKEITVRRTTERWPFFHSCTNQLDLPRFTSHQDLTAALNGALASGYLGGFSEFAHIGAGAANGGDGGGDDGDRSSGGGGGLSPRDEMMSMMNPRMRAISHLASGGGGGGPAGLLGGLIQALGGGGGGGGPGGGRSGGSHQALAAALLGGALGSDMEPEDLMEALSGHFGAPEASLTSSGSSGGDLGGEHENEEEMGEEEEEEEDDEDDEAYSPEE